MAFDPDIYNHLSNKGGNVCIYMTTETDRHTRTQKTEKGLEKKNRRRQDHTAGMQSKRESKD